METGLLERFFFRAPQCSHCKRCTSYGNSVRLSHAGIVPKRRHVARCSVHCQIAKCVQFCRNQKVLLRDDPFRLKAWLKLTYPLLIAASLDTFCLWRLNRKSQRKQFNYDEQKVVLALSNEPSTKVLCRPQLPQNGDKLPKFVVFWTISTIQDEKSAASFITVCKNCHRQSCSASIAFRVISIYWQGDDPFPVKSYQRMLTLLVVTMLLKILYLVR